MIVGIQWAIRPTWRVMLGVGLVLLALAISAQHAKAATIYDGDLRVQLYGCPLTDGSMGPVSASCSDIYGQGSGFANYTHLGVMGATAGSAFTSISEMFDTVTISGIAVGTQVALTFVTQYDGFYAFHATGPSDDANLSTTVLLAFNQANNYIINGGQSLEFCGLGLAPMQSCYAYGSSLAGPAPGVTLVSSQVITSAGTGVPIHLEFSLFVDASTGASISGDFLDPFTLTNILVTDPTTGQPIAGATISGASGATYPVKVSSTPEPSTWLTLTTGILLVGGLRLREGGNVRQSCYSESNSPITVGK